MPAPRPNFGSGNLRLVFENCKVVPWRFFSVPEVIRDGHGYAANAVGQRAAAMMVELPLDLEAPQLQVDSFSRRLSSPL